MTERFCALDPNLFHRRDHIAQLWEDLEKQYNIFITMHDHLGSLRLADSTVLRKDGNIHRSRSCAFCRKYFSHKCIEHCRWQAMQEAARRREPFLSRCYAGAVEIVMPVIVRNEHAATAFIGTFRYDHWQIPENWSAARREAYLSLPVWQEERAGQLLRILEMFCAAALNFAENDRLGQQSIAGLPGEILNFFQTSLGTREVSLGDLAEKLHLSPSRTSHILQKEFQKSFSKLLAEARIARACRMLVDTRLSLYSIATACGFRNVYYFARVFKQQTGIPPGQYRRQVTPDIQV